MCFFNRITKKNKNLKKWRSSRRLFSIPFIRKLERWANIFSLENNIWTKKRESECVGGIQYFVRFTKIHSCEFPRFKSRQILDAYTRTHIMTDFFAPIALSM